MLRQKGLTDKLLLLGIDGLDPRFTKKMIEEGRMPNTQKLLARGAAREDLMLLGAMPTITPPMWATLGTGAYPMTHGIEDFYISAPGQVEVSLGAFFSKFCKAEPLWNVTAQAGKKTLVWHWPGGAWPPTIDSDNLMMVDGTSPGNIGMVYATRDIDTALIASENCPQLAYMPYSTVTSKLEGDESLKVPSFPVKSGKWDERMQRVFEQFKEGLGFNGYEATKEDVKIKFAMDGSMMWILADFPIAASLSPITVPKDWHIDIPQGAKEFTLVYGKGKEKRPALILQNTDGQYDRVVIYSDKQTVEPLTILERDVFTDHVPDTIMRRNGTCQVFRNMRLLELAEDGSYVRIWASKAIDCNDDSVWYPKELFQDIKQHFGPPHPTGQMGSHDRDLVLKCVHEQWARSADWQADCLQYMMDEKDMDVIFSHYHGPDLQGHNYMKYLKERDTSVFSEMEVREFAEATYALTDHYIGRFLPYLDQGWTILVFSDHALVCPEQTPHILGDNGSVNLEFFQDKGYTVLKQDENGTLLPEIDWSQTTAVQVRSNSIYINLKGRDPQGIVDPHDKYELEERIITDLYNYRDETTGHRIIALALHNKDAVLLGLGGPDGADIVFWVHENYVLDHGNSLSTACGYANTSVSPIFMAAGPGIKENYVIERYIREVDIAPTAAVLLGVDIPAQCEGAPAYQIFTEKL